MQIGLKKAEYYQTIYFHIYKTGKKVLTFGNIEIEKN